ncbi:hypothetical protein NDU88_005597 [Pleurodeles waltl]|uniref:Uncharacterized protein n=1 Tax=Pleurodeles waltl TaxID=8319 RepID=A0AAV7L4W7_PLEWA|nr:hypothetical protein NDU88_005597 [Pleurodeles waltl]
MESVQSGEPCWRASLPSRSRSNSRLRGRVQHVGSQGHPYTYIGSSSPLGRRDTGPRAPASDAAFGAAAPFHLRGEPRVCSRRIRFIKPRQLRLESRGSGMPPRSPLIESDYPDARSRESFDLNNTCLMPPLSAIKRRFSGAPQLPPLMHRQAAANEYGKAADTDQGSRVVFTIEETGPGSGYDDSDSDCSG